MPTETLPFDPNQVPKLLKEGRIKVVRSPQVTSSERAVSTDRMTERAKDILGKDFLGVEAVRNMEAKLKGVGQAVEFDTAALPPIPYTEKDLELARQHGEMLVLRVGLMRLGGREVPLSLINFRELFRTDPLNKLSTPYFAFRSDANDWYKDQPFATKGGEIGLSWALVAKNILPGSNSKTLNQQARVMETYATNLQSQGASRTEFRRRTATEAAYDTLLYYVNNGEQLLSDKYDWTQTRTSDGRLVLVGYFDSGGLGVDYWDPTLQYPNIGVCLSR
ncbi:MAG: hypothetical protein G01um10147_138 [Microgenomates group bacterium Gr01-1014_7]|nr:MAG: hypothetical protein G01um10147_138 [Microgenomates group bacterium Gr01-1014_7]